MGCENTSAQSPVSGARGSCRLQLWSTFSPRSLPHRQLACARGRGLNPLVVVMMAGSSPAHPSLNPVQSRAPLCRPNPAPSPAPFPCFSYGPAPSWQKAEASSGAGCALEVAGPLPSLQVSSHLCAFPSNLPVSLHPRWETQTPQAQRLPLNSHWDHRLVQGHLSAKPRGL